MAERERDQRILDPIHGLIVFRDDVDRLAWDLLGSPEMQRLRRIKQLGLSEFVFPGATHSRFAHSVGVFHLARELVRIIERELPDGAYDRGRAEVAVIAALLHDIGHGPLSHAFENVEKARGHKKRHEHWSAEMVLNKVGGIMPVLLRHRSDRPDLGELIATLLLKEVPADIYDAVVSSSFDADRLDYLQRDRLMTGTGAGAIDFNWLLDNLTVDDIDMEPDGAEAGDVRRPSFCLRHKALHAAEVFLLARYHLYKQVYLHKTTRGAEQMVQALLRAVADLVGKDDGYTQVNLPAEHPLVKHFAAGEPALGDYLALDDAVVWGAIERMEAAPNAFVRELAQRMRRRDLYKGFDLETEVGPKPELQRRKKRRLDEAYATEIGRTVLRDEIEFGVYGEVGADDAKAHKRLMIIVADEPSEITSVSDVIDASLSRPRRMIRYYFASDTARETARAV